MGPGTPECIESNGVEDAVKLVLCVWNLERPMHLLTMPRSWQSLQSWSSLARVFHLVAFGSRKLTLPQQLYPPCLWCWCTRWICCCPISSSCILSTRVCSGSSTPCTACWLNLLAQYQYSVLHIPCWANPAGILTWKLFHDCIRLALRTSQTRRSSSSQRQARGRGTQWRRSGEFIAQSPGCRQGTILAPVAAWQLLLGSGAFLALGHFGSTKRHQVAENHRRDVTSACAITTRSDASSPLAPAALAARAYPAWFRQRRRPPGQQLSPGRAGGTK